MTTDLLRFRGGGVATTSAGTTPATAVSFASGVRGALITVDGNARILVTENGTPLTPNATNMGYVSAGAYTVTKGGSDTHVQIAGDALAVNYKIAWLI